MEEINPVADDLYKYLNFNEIDFPALSDICWVMIASTNASKGLEIVLILHSPTGSFFTVDIETNDNLVVDTEDANNEVVISFHNPPQKLEPPK